MEDNEYNWDNESNMNKGNKLTDKERLILLDNKAIIERNEEEIEKLMSIIEETKKTIEKYPDDNFLKLDLEQYIYLKEELKKEIADKVRENFDIKYL